MRKIESRWTLKRLDEYLKTSGNWHSWRKFETVESYSELYPLQSKGYYIQDTNRETFYYPKARCHLMFNTYQNPFEYTKTQWVF